MPRFSEKVSLRRIRQVLFLLLVLAATGIFYDPVANRLPGFARLILGIVAFLIAAYFVFTSSDE